MCVFRTCAIFVQLYGFTIQKVGDFLEYNVKKMSQFAHFFSENEIRSQPVYTSKFNTIEDFYQIAILEIGGIFLWK